MVYENYFQSIKGEKGIAYHIVVMKDHIQTKRSTV